jgi:hypothetical protein
MDVIKSKIQGTPLSNTHTHTHTHTSTHIHTVARQIWEREGVRGFFKGLGPSLLRAFPVNAVTFIVYDSLLKRIQEGGEK